jgi:hypothetical protein
MDIRAMIAFFMPNFLLIGPSEGTGRRSCNSNSLP